MKSVLMSIHPKWCEFIANGKKTVEVRKNKPKLEVPFKCYIYCTSIKYMNLDEYVRLHRATYGKIDQWHGKVIGEFVCDQIDEFHDWQLKPYGKFRDNEQKELENFLKKSCLSYDEVLEYRKNLEYYQPIYGWHISNLKIYEEPKELSEFHRFCSNYEEDIYDICDLTCPHAISETEGYFEYFRGCNNIVTCAPQSWMYINDWKGDKRRTQY